jgi:hypothetical protein
LNNDLRTQQLSLTNSIDAMSMTQAAYSLAKVLKAGFDMAERHQATQPHGLRDGDGRNRGAATTAPASHPGHTKGQPPAGSVPVGKVNDRAADEGQEMSLWPTDAAMQRTAFTFGSNANLQPLEDRNP